MTAHRLAVIALASAASACTLLAPSRAELVGDGGGGTGAGPSCEAPFFEAGGSCYVQLQDEAPWEDARADCKARGALLAVLGSAAEIDLVTPRLDVLDQTWIGGFDTAPQSAMPLWAWADSDEPWWDHWGAGQPDGQPGMFPDCVVLNGGLFDDHGCGSLQPYLCERGP